MHVNTHPRINQRLCGEVIEASEGRARVRLETVAEMVADEEGLVHGGFVFGLADYAAMVAVNDPLVVLGGAEVRFKAPVKLGDVVVAVAERTAQKGRKHSVEVSASVGDKEVFTGTFTTFVLDQHVLEGS